MNETQIKELRAHAGKLVAEGKPLSGVFLKMHGNQWYAWLEPNTVPDFTDGKQWRITKPKLQLIDWSHPYFKGCATNFGEFVSLDKSSFYTANVQRQVCCGLPEALRLATPANEHANWQPFFSTPENDAKLRELAKMVKVEVRYFAHEDEEYYVSPLSASARNFSYFSNYRIIGLQDGWTDNPEEAKS